MSNLGVAVASVPGRQTVPRAEISGATMCYGLATEKVSSDCLHVVNTVEEIESLNEHEVSHCRALKGLNHDLWLAWWQERQRRGTRVVGKVKAHLSLEDVLQGTISYHEWLGNAIADALAGAAAWQAADDDLTRATLSRNAALAYSVSMRIAFIEADVARAKELKNQWEVVKAESRLAMRAATDLVNDRIKMQGHQLRRAGRGKLRCVNCSVSKPVGAAAWWLANPCSKEEGGQNKTLFAGRVRELPAPTPYHAASEVGDHRLLPAGSKWVCMLCGFVGAREQVPSLCEDKGVFTLEREVVVADMARPAWLTAARREAEEHAKKSNENKARLRAAMASWATGLKSIEAEAPRGDEAGPAPKWIERIHKSHAELYFAGGLVYCGACSCVSSAAAGNSRLWSVCSGATATGSLGRRQRLRTGCHPHLSMYEVEYWPDGRPATQKLNFRKYVRVAQVSPSRRGTLQVEQQRYFTVPDIADANPSAQELAEVVALLDAWLESFMTDSEAEVPDFTPLFDIGPAARVAGAVNKWLGSSKWEQAIDSLLERSFPFESALADAVGEAKSKRQRELELNPLAQEEDDSD